jgi:ACT domain-containing protein
VSKALWVRVKYTYLIKALYKNNPAKKATGVVSVKKKRTLVTSNVVVDQFVISVGKIINSNLKETLEAIGQNASIVDIKVPKYHKLNENALERQIRRQGWPSKSSNLQLQVYLFPY